MDNMKYSITHEYIKNDTILVRTLKGCLSLLDLANSADDDIKKGIIHSGLIGVITHHVDTDFSIDVNDMKLVAAVYDKHLDLLTKIKWAVVIDFSAVALPSLLKRKNPRYNMQSFTEFSSALRWVERVD